MSSPRTRSPGIVMLDAVLALNGPLLRRSAAARAAAGHGRGGLSHRSHRPALAGQPHRDPGRGARAHGPGHRLPGAHHHAGASRCDRRSARCWRHWRSCSATPWPTPSSSRTSSTGRAWARTWPTPSPPSTRPPSPGLRSWWRWPTCWPTSSWTSSGPIVDPRLRMTAARRRAPPDRAPAALRVRGGRRSRLRSPGIPGSSSAWAIIALLVGAALLAPWIAPHPEDAGTATDLLNTLQPPGGEHPLGTDLVGRDVFSPRALRSLVLGRHVACWSSPAALLIGVPIGLFSGAIGGWVDDILMRARRHLPGLPVAAAGAGHRRGAGPLARARGHRHRRRLVAVVRAADAR